MDADHADTQKALPPIARHLKAAALAVASAMAVAAAFSDDTEKVVKRLTEWVTEAKAAQLELSSVTDLDGLPGIDSGGKVLYPKGFRARLTAKLAKDAKFAQLDPIKIKITELAPLQLDRTPHGERPAWGNAPLEVLHVTFANQHSGDAVVDHGEKADQREFPVVTPKHVAIRLDASNGFVEAYDLVVAATEPGTYSVSFTSQVIGEGQGTEVNSQSVIIVLPKSDGGM